MIPRLHGILLDTRPIDFLSLAFEYSISMPKILWVKKTLIDS